VNLNDLFDLFPGLILLIWILPGASQVLSIGPPVLCETQAKPEIKVITKASKNMILLINYLSSSNGMSHKWITIIFDVFKTDE
jgi:hypothetical protein